MSIRHWQCVFGSKDLFLYALHDGQEDVADALARFLWREGEGTWVLSTVEKFNRREAPFRTVPAYLGQYEVPGGAR